MPLEILLVDPCLQQNSGKVGIWKSYTPGEVLLVLSEADTTVVTASNGISHLWGFFFFLFAFAPTELMLIRCRYISYIEKNKKYMQLFAAW